MTTTGRVSGKLSTALRDRIASGLTESGGYLPTIRDLCREHGLAARTVQRALGLLESEGLIVAEPRRGYRVLARAFDPQRSMPLAYVLGTNDPPGKWDGLHTQLSVAIQNMASRMGWSYLAIAADEHSNVATVIEKLRAARASGVVLDTLDQELIQATTHLGLPVVVVDAWIEEMPISAVIQDNYLGGFMAAKYLLDRGHRDLCWFGSKIESAHNRERCAGASAALHKAELQFAPERYINTTKEEMEADAYKLLGESNRPQAVLALWRDLAVAVAKAARARSLVLGKDLDLVGWCLEELYEPGYRAMISPELPAVAICWSASTMADTALRRLAELRARPDAPKLRIHIPIRLRTA